MQIVTRVFSYLFNSSQTGWRSVLLHDVAVIFLFFVITQILAIGALVSMLLGVAPISDDAVLEDVRFSLLYFGLLILIVYLCVLLLRARDCWVRYVETRKNCNTNPEDQAANAD